LARFGKDGENQIGGKSEVLGFFMEILTEKQRTAILALLSGKTRAQTAKEAGVVESTVYLWLSDEGFRKELQKAKNLTFDYSTAMLTGLLEDSIQICRRILSGEKLSSLELRAASLIFSQVARFRELDLEDKIRELERRFENERK
jgi:enoyl-CoA hydratase/carnithine racemase